MNIISFNINGLRARLHQLSAIIEKHNPDIIGLQEIKVSDEQFPLDDIKKLGYHVYYHGQKGHYGVALLSKKKAVKINKGFLTDDTDAQKRFIWGEFISSFDNKKMIIMNGYFPQGENQDHPIKYPAKKKFYEDLQNLLKSNFSKEDNIILMGDINISPEDIDIGIGEKNQKRWLKTGKCSFLPEEREWLKKIQEWGFVDTYRANNNGSQYSWFDYRSRGFNDTPKRGLRIDVILCTNSISKNIKDSGIDYEIREMEKPSDHAPIWLNLK